MVKICRIEKIDVLKQKVKKSARQSIFGPFSKKKKSFCSTKQKSVHCSCQKWNFGNLSLEHKRVHCSYFSFNPVLSKKWVLQKPNAFWEKFVDFFMFLKNAEEFTDEGKMAFFAEKWKIRLCDTFWKNESHTGSLDTFHIKTW